jgi:hypothetical protein
MNRRLRQELQAKLRGKIGDAVSHALNSGEDGAGSLKVKLEEIESYSKLLSFCEPKWAADSGLAAAVAVACLAVAGLLWNLKVRRTNISLTVETDSFHGELARDWHLDSPFQAQVVHFERLSAAQAPNLGLSLDESAGDVWFRLEGGQVGLQSLQIDKGAFVEVSANVHEVSVSVGRRPLRGTLTVTGKGTLTAGRRAEEASLHRAYDLDVPETLEFATRDPGGTPSQVTVHSPQKWSLGAVPLDNLSFAVEEVKSPAESELTSGIQSGTVQFNDTSWPVLPLFENELLAVRRTGEARIEARSGESSIHVTVNGFVKNVAVGDAEARRELAPSWLEYLYNKRSLTFFWGAVVFVWGLLWGIRKTALR